MTSGSKHSPDTREILELKLQYLEDKINESSSFSVNNRQMEFLLNEVDRVRANLLELETVDHYEQLFNKPNN